MHYSSHGCFYLTHSVFFQLRSPQRAKTKAFNRYNNSCIMYGLHTALTELSFTKYNQFTFQNLLWLVFNVIQKLMFTLTFVHPCHHCRRHQVTILSLSYYQHLKQLCISRKNSSVTHTASVTKQYNLVPANGRWCSTAGEVTAGLVESNGSLPSGLWLWSPAGWLPRTGISSGTLHSFRVRD